MPACVLIFMKYELKTEVSVLSVPHKLKNMTLGTWRVKHSHQHKKRSEFTDLLEQSKRSLGENSLMYHELTQYCK